MPPRCVPIVTRSGSCLSWAVSMHLLPYHEEVPPVPRHTFPQEVGVLLLVSFAGLHPSAIELCRLELPPEVHAEEIIEPLVVRLEVLLKTTPGCGVHLVFIAALVASLRNDLRGFKLPVGQAEEF